METKFTEQQSLALINEMIDQARNNFRKGAGNITIFWGCLVAFTALLNFSLAFVLPNNQSCLVWFLMIPGWIVSYFMRTKIDETGIVRTQIDRIINATWMAFGISIVLLLLTFWGVSYHFKIYQHFTMLNSVILMMTGAAQFITGKACRFKPYVYGGYIFWAGSLICIIILPYVVFHFLVLTVTMLFGYIIPGVKLNKKAEGHV